ncbi:hypothetical protein X802_05735 [Thermococcus guaymasensis DSM 11113]|uniref:Uncharacterized protein n=1 Tax=Thermococcus guaymasensis DSM 11113 TaxID=1432656 RepID=A0A0X1KN94_9EURY|nr:hypothetical protein [Thermococcus guaymasensis]AJC72729.1 hypothetical protein X802_05735 [Thermococcus guaymasensis DSM 11113]
MKISRLEALSLLVSLAISIIFLDMFPVYVKKDVTIGAFILVEAIISLLLFFLIRWGYSALTGVISATSLGVLIILRPPAIYLRAVSIPWWAIGVLYLVIVIVSVALTNPMDEKRLNIISLLFVSVFLLISLMAAYEGFKLPLPPDVLRGLSATTKMKTWRSMGILLGLMNAGAAVSMLRGKYLHYLLLISFTLPPLFTVTLSFGKITFGVFSQVLLLAQVGVSGLVVSWHMGGRR